MMSRDAKWKAGRIAGLQEALDMLRDLEGDVAERLHSPAPTKTRDARRVRKQAYKNGARRIETRLRQVTTDKTRLEAELERIAL